MKDFNLRLYLVTDESCLPCGRDLFSAVEEALQAGVTLVQYREKNGLGKDMLEKARAMVALCHKYNVPLIVNDRLDIALLSGADGVHLGQDDIPVAEARRMADLFFANCTATRTAYSSASCDSVNDTVSTMEQHGVAHQQPSNHFLNGVAHQQTGNRFLIGVAHQQTGNHFLIGATAHNVQEALAAEAAGADYLGCGAVFATSTKKDTVPLGIDGLKAIRKAVTIPITGIAGITTDNYQQVLATGANGVAVVSAILGAEDITATVKNFRL